MAYSRTTKYARRMERLSQRIFTEVARKTDVKSMRVVQLYSAMPVEQDEKRNTKYYPPHPMFHYLTKLLRMYGIYRDEHFDFADEMTKQRALRGKVVPPIGQGKLKAKREKG